MEQPLIGHKSSVLRLAIIKIYINDIDVRGLGNLRPRLTKTPGRLVAWSES